MSDHTLPDLLLFPRAELQAGVFCFYPVSIACAVILQGEAQDSESASYVTREGDKHE